MPKLDHACKVVVWGAIIFVLSRQAIPEKLHVPSKSFAVIIEY